MWSLQRNHLKEPKATLNENRLLAKEKLTCRILDFSLMDQIHFATLRKYVAPHETPWTLFLFNVVNIFFFLNHLHFRSVINKRFYRYQDIKAGDVVEVS